MKPDNHTDASDVSLDLHHPSAVAIAAEELACEHFAAWLDVELDKLVLKWKHLAAPNASRGKVRFNRSSH